MRNGSERRKLLKEFMLPRSKASARFSRRGFEPTLVNYNAMARIVIEKRYEKFCPEIIFF